MPEINANIVVEPYNIVVSTIENQISLTPETFQLSLFTSGFTPAAGNFYELQYNNSGTFGGIPTVTYANGNLNLGTVSNVKLNGGTNGYVLQTDGTGNLTWTAQTGGGGGNGVPGGANTQIQYNDSGSFNGAAGFTFNEVTGDVNIPNKVTSVEGNIGNTLISNTGIVTPGYYGNITGANVISALNVVINDNVKLAPNIEILSNTNPNSATPGNTSATFKYPIAINGNLYYLNLSANI